MPYLFKGTVATRPGVLSYRVYVYYRPDKTTIKEYTVKFIGGKPPVDEKPRSLGNKREPTDSTVQTLARDTFGERVAEVAPCASQEGFEEAV